MSNRDFFIVFTLFALIFVYPLQAVENESAEQNEIKTEVTKEPTVTKSPEIRNKNAVKEKYMMEKERIKNKIEEQREIIKKKREEIKENLLMKKEEFQASMSAEREEFKKKMEEFRDERKKAAVEKLDQRINIINATKTSNLLDILNRLTAALDKIESKSKELQPADISSVSVAIQEAREAITKAKSDVEKQAGKNYVIQISSEEGVKSDVSTLVQNMKSELQTAIESVRNSKRAVQSAHNGLKI